MSQNPSIPPELLAQWMGLGSMEEEGDLLAQQMAQAEAMRKGSGRQYSTGAGAALGGLGDAIGSTAGAFQQKNLQGQQADLLRRKDVARKSFGSAWNEQQQAQQKALQDLMDEQRVRRMAQPVPGSAGAGDLPALSSLFGLR